MDFGDFHRLRRYLMVLARGLFVALTVYFAASRTGQYIVDQLPTKFKATSQVIVEARPEVIVQARPEGDPAVNSDALDPAAELEIIRSPLVLQPVIDELGLDRTWATRVFGVDPRQLASGEALGHMNKILTVKFKPGTYLMEITASSDVPEEAAAIANAVADSYKTKRDAEQLQIEQSHDPQKASVRQQIAGVERTIDVRRSEMEALRVRLEAKGIQMDPQSVDPTDPDLQNYRNDERDMEDRRHFLGTLKAQLAQNDNEGYPESRVQIETRAVLPQVASSPNRKVDYLITDVIAILLSVGVASSSEVIFLLLRAAERPES